MLLKFDLKYRNAIKEKRFVNLSFSDAPARDYFTYIYMINR